MTKVTEVILPPNISDQRWKVIAKAPLRNKYIVLFAGILFDDVFILIMNHWYFEGVG
ncbi:hypothetical protein LEP1GSC203_3760 [Leptospira terpstrae serovar Hualin str. LT 11-33 = ATCC 700639]|uniref:Uncharacterized protein n=1 Tax=Leptospira terpstrae serovar Hualin str. LT 11-33 = ATCC 700639 TaxID=1257025 RepID=N1VYJ1_9LEPT|nr:hypothetical protein LEP1GSC203_3760 [Leptospira terpstrae serovar Hualin str. LT 11-33 = ATCC 700639]